MVQCKALKQLEFIEQKKFDDEDIQGDIDFLKEKMEASLQDLRQLCHNMTAIKDQNLKNIFYAKFEWPNVQWISEYFSFQFL